MCYYNFSPRFEPHPVQQYICSPENCVIFGGHDYYPPVEICGRRKFIDFLNTLVNEIWRVGCLESRKKATIF